MTEAAELSRHVRRRNGSKHDKTGCLTCRYRHKKCAHNTFPVCGDCKRLNLACFREPVGQVFPSASTPMVTTSAPQKSLGVHVNRDFSKRRSAMNFYITVLSQLLTVSDRDNCFLSAFLPMTLESPALTDALVAWSAGHLISHDHCYRLTALEARANSLKYLTLSLRARGIESSEVNAATSLVLMTSENIIMSAQYYPASTGKSQIWGPDALKKTPEGKWILRNFAYHDILGSVTLGKQPLIPSHYLHDVADVVDTYIGVAFGILLIISDISGLDSSELVDDFSSTTEFSEATHRCFSYIEQRLTSWVCQPGTNSALESLAYTYRSAALIYLYRRTIRELKVGIVHHGPQDRCFIRDLHSRIQDEVSVLLQHTTGIPSGAIVESALLFPLFMAGGEATDPVHMRMIVLRLELMLEKRPFKNIQQALEVLEAVWEQRKSSQITYIGYCQVDWKDVVDQRNEPLLLT